MAWPSSRYKTATNGGSWTPGDMNGVQDQYIRADGIVTADLNASAVTNAVVSSSAAIAGSKLDTGDGRLVQTNGLVACSGALSLTTSYADVTGATVTFTPDVACHALVVASFELQVFAVGAQSALTMNAQGALVVDGTPETDYAYITHVFPAMTDPTHYATVVQVYKVALTAASHTLKLQAKKSANDFSATCGTRTNFLYQLVAQ